MGKYISKCEFGVVHATANCRCPNLHETIRQVKCDVPDEHKPKLFVAEVITSETTPVTLRERLEKSVDAFFGNMVMPIVRETLVDKLEQDVKDWLLDNITELRG